MGNYDCSLLPIYITGWRDQFLIHDLFGMYLVGDLLSLNYLLPFENINYLELVLIDSGDRLNVIYGTKGTVALETLARILLYWNLLNLSKK